MGNQARGRQLILIPSRDPDLASQGCLPEFSLIPAYTVCVPSAHGMPIVTWGMAIPAEL